MNINSRLFYEAMTTYGKALAASERIFLVMFCNERVAMGNWVGLPLQVLLPLLRPRRGSHHRQ